MHAFASSLQKDKENLEQSLENLQDKYNQLRDELKAQKNNNVKFIEEIKDLKMKLLNSKIGPAI